MGVAPRCTHRLRQQEAAFERAEEGARWQEGAEPRDWRAGRGAAGGVGVRVGVRVWGPHGDGGTDKAWPRSLCPRTREGSGNPGCAEGEKRQASSAVGCIPSPPRPRPASPLAPSSSPSLLPLFRPPSSSSFRTPAIQAAWARAGPDPPLCWPGASSDPTPFPLTPVLAVRDLFATPEHPSELPPISSCLEGLSTLALSRS